MSDGGIVPGITYTATIHISGKMSEEDLKAVVKQISDTLSGKTPDDKVDVKGTISNKFRISTKLLPKLKVKASFES